MNQPARVTPGSVALLGNDLAGAGADGVLRAISDEDPAVRTVAARIAAVTSHTSFLPALQAAWARETDAAAAAEQARALLNIQGASAIGMIELKLESLPQRAASVYAGWLAESSAERFVSLLPRLAARFTDGGSLNSSMTMVLKSRPDLAERMLHAYRSAVPRLSWSSVLKDISLDKASPELVAILIDGIYANEADLRTETVWAMITRLSAGKTVPQSLLEGVAARTTGGTTQVSPTWDEFGREILIRELHRKASTDRAKYVEEQITKHWYDARALASTSYLTDGERNALKRGLGNQFPQSEPGAATAPLERNEAALRTMPTLWPGFLKSLLDESRCAPGSNDGRPGAVTVTYRPNRTLQTLAVTPTTISAECEAATTALARLTLADLTYLRPGGGAELLILPLNREFAGCTNEQRDRDDAIVKVGGIISPPKKVHNVTPVYPETLQKQRVEGTVVIEATIGATGCVTAGKVIRGVDMALDYSALQAVMGWRFTPTLVENVPVPVLMTVTVNFRLR
jgi:TonB family protein